MRHILLVYWQYTIYIFIFKVVWIVKLVIYVDNQLDMEVILRVKFWKEKWKKVCWKYIIKIFILKLVRSLNYNDSYLPIFDSQDLLWLCRIQDDSVRQIWKKKNTVIQFTSSKSLNTNLTDVSIGFVHQLQFLHNSLSWFLKRNDTLTLF